MIKFELDYLGLKVEIALDTNDAEKAVEHIYTGSPDAIAEVRDALGNAYGLFGHTLDSNAPASDLQYALFSKTSDMKYYNPVVLEGQEILDAWTLPELPEGAVY